jgi:hypothetical protein
VSTSRTSSLTSIGTFSSLPAHWFQALVGLWRIRSGRWELAFHRLVAKTRGRAFIAICFKSWTKGGDVVGSFVNAAADAAGGPGSAGPEPLAVRQVYQQRPLVGSSFRDKFKRGSRPQSARQD